MQYQWEPNEAQRAAIEAPVNGAYRVISGPGSGKTFVETNRIAFLVENGVDSNRILSVVFNRRNADEMAERVRAIVPNIDTKWITTIHAACLRLFQGDDEAFPGGSKYRVLDSETQWLKEYKFSVKSFIQTEAEELWPNPDGRPGWKEIWTLILNSKMRGLTPAESGAFFNDTQTAYHGERIYKLYMDLWAKMKALKLLTFADMLLLVDVQLRRDSTFRSRCQAMFTHVLVDEGQDVSGQAMRILTTLAAPQDNFFIVGDQDQLLYRFTGATPEANLMEGFEERFPNGTTIQMGTNYRSENTLVVSNAGLLIANNYSDAGGPYEQRYMKDLECKPGSVDGRNFSVMAYARPEVEADAVADSLAALLVPTDDDGILVPGTLPGQVFVGARTRAQLGYLEGPMLRRNIPFINIAGGSFWTSKHVADVVAYVALANDMGNREAFERVYNIGSNWMTIPWRKSAQYGDYCNHRYLGAAFVAACGGSFLGMKRAANTTDGWRYRAGIDDLESFVYELKAHLDEGPAVALQFVIDNCYRKWMQADEGLTVGDEAENGKLEDLRTVTEIAAQHATVSEFLAYVAQCVKAAEDAKAGNWNEYVIISTVHRLKGLERDVVFGIGWGEGYTDTEKGPEPRGLLPHTFSLTTPPQHGVLNIGGAGRVEDERCLAFVLVTRARKDVYLSYPQEYRGANFGPSRFLAEMGLTQEPGIEPEGPEGDLSEEEYARLEGLDDGSVADAEETDGEGDALPATAAVDFYAFLKATSSPFPDSDRKDEGIPCGEMGSVLRLFPKVGEFEGTIYKPSAWELAAALPDFTPAIDGNELVFEKELGGGSTLFVRSSIKVGQAAEGTGQDSIRVTRRDVSERGTFWFKDRAAWVNRRVPKDATTHEAAVAHIVGKVRDNVAKIVRECPACGKTQILCGSRGNQWWKGLDGCRCK